MNKILYVLPALLLTALGFSQEMNNVNLETNTDSIYVSITQSKKRLYTKGDFFFKHEVYDSAASYYDLENEIMLRDKKIDDYEEETYADNNLNLSKCNLEQGDLEKALKNIEIAKEHAKKCNDDVMLSEIYFNEHQIYKRQGKIDDAIKILGQAIEYITNNTSNMFVFPIIQKEVSEIIPSLCKFIEKNEKLKTYYKTMGDLLGDNGKIFELENGDERNSYDFYNLEFRLEESIKKCKSLVIRFSEEEKLKIKLEKQKIEQ